MLINFTDLIIKASPAGNQGVSVSLVENNPAATVPTEQKNAVINTATLSPAELTTVNNFIALLKSKL